MTLKDLRVKRELTQEQLAKLAGFSIKYISEMENGRRNPSDKAKKKLAKPLGVKPVDIFLACQRTICSKDKERR